MVVLATHFIYYRLYKPIPQERDFGGRRKEMFWYAIFMKDRYGVFCWVRHNPNEKCEGCEFLEVKKIPEEIAADKIEDRVRELKKQHGSFKKWRG